MATEYARLYLAQGEEQAEAYLHAISNQLSSTPLSLAASDEEIIAFARKQAEQFTRLQRLFCNPAIAARFLCHLAQHKYGVTPPGSKGQAKLQSAKSLSLPVTGSAGKPLAPVTETGKPEPVFSVTVTGKTDLFPVRVTGKSQLAFLYPLPIQESAMQEF